MRKTTYSSVITEVSSAFIYNPRSLIIDRPIVDTVTETGSFEGRRVIIIEDVITDNMLYIVASVTALFKCTIAIKQT